ncbi:tyrosine-type recombinase/integrase [Sphaerotilaceae bacterium SBD11-9]
MNEPEKALQTALSIRLAVLAPLEQLEVVDVMSGREGTNRSRAGHRQIGADTDREAVLAWLARHADSPSTLANSRKEVERLLLWCLAELGKPLSSLTHEDLLLFQRFLANPLPAERWVMTSGRKLPRSHPGWRPFAGPLSPLSQRQAMVTINSLLSWLVQAGYLAGNPLSLSRQRQSRSTPRVIRFLEEDLWAEVRRTIASMPQQTTREQATYARARWLLSMLYLCGLRISEIAGNRMGDFFPRADKDGQERWWLHVRGKGNKERLVPATAELMVELAMYRRAVGLPAVPPQGDTTPLVLPVWWRAAEATERPAPLTRASLHGVVKDVFAMTADRLKPLGAGYAAKVARLELASSHWLRHTMGSRLANTIDLRHVRDTLGHASISTTSVYLHAEDDVRHAAISSAHRLGWDTWAPTPT